MVHPPYSKAAKLVWIGVTHWEEIDGIAASQGLRPLDLPPHRFLNYIWAWVVPRVKDQEEFIVELERPLPNLPQEKKQQAAATPENYNAWASMIAGG